MTQFDNELKTLQRELEADQERLAKATPGSEAEFIWACCVAVRAKSVVSFVKESHPELRG